jgi:DcaP outer membrane protein
VRALVAAVVLLLASSSANAQTSAPVEGGPSAAKTEKVEEPQPPPPAPEPAPDGFTVGGFVFRPGGRIKLDIIRDFGVIGSEDSFDPRTIPTDGSEGGNSQLHARETRLFLDVRGPVEGKELKMYIETDFYGSGNVFRLRHAYGSYGGLLAGQTWSTFVDEDNMPNTIDFESPMAFPSFRQAQLRYTRKLAAKVSWSVAVEDNKSSIQTPAGIPGKAEYSMPDLATRVRFVGSRGHVFASAFLGRARFRPTQGEPDDVSLWGGNVSARLKTSGRDYAYTQLTFGDGVGRYRGGVTAVPDASGKLQPVGVVALMGGYEHFWSPRLSSNAVYSEASAPSEVYYAADFNKRLDYGAVNLIYWFLPGRAWAGVEYLYGKREVFGGQDGTANRVQFAVRFNLP